MAFGVNRSGTQPRATFRLAGGGSSIKFRHPYFIGQIDGTPLDEIDISASLKLEGRYFEATLNQDSAKQVVMIDGSVVTVCNRLLNGTLRLPVVRTTGFLGTGDFISGCQLIQSVGDTVGGCLYKIDRMGSKALITLFYGVTVKSCPVDVSEGNDVAVYNVELLFAGWIQAQGKTADVAAKKIWAVGNKEGLDGIYAPYSIQNPTGNTGTGTDALTMDNLDLPNNTDIYDDTDETNQITAKQPAAGGAYANLYDPTKIPNPADKKGNNGATTPNNAS